MFEEKLLEETCQQMGIHLTQDLTQEQMGQFATYQQLLLEWNEKINLTTIIEPKEIAIKHFADSLSVASVVPLKEGSRVIDVGTGAGFPGIPVKIGFPNVEMTLLDSLQKRIGFLEEAVEQLDLTDVVCVHSRAEDGGKNPLYREQFDYCISRAVANLAVLSEYCLPFVAVGGLFLSLKGPDVESELLTAEKAIETLGGKVEQVYSISIPNSDLHHRLVCIRKVEKTPSQYPRKAGKATKKPIQ